MTISKATVDPAVLRFPTFSGIVMLMRYQLKQTLAVERRWSSEVASMASHRESSKSATPACGFVIVGPDCSAAGLQIGADGAGISIFDFHFVVSPLAVYQTDTPALDARSITASGRPNGGS